MVQFRFLMYSPHLFWGSWRKTLFWLLCRWRNRLLKETFSRIWNYYTKVPGQGACASRSPCCLLSTLSLFKLTQTPYAQTGEGLLNIRGIRCQVDSSRLPWSSSSAFYSSAVVCKNQGLSWKCGPLWWQSNDRTVAKVWVTGRYQETEKHPELENSGQKEGAETSASSLRGVVSREWLCERNILQIVNPYCSCHATIVIMTTAAPVLSQDSLVILHHT